MNTRRQRMRNLEGKKLRSWEYENHNPTIKCKRFMKLVWKIHEVAWGYVPRYNNVKSAKHKANTPNSCFDHKLIKIISVVGFWDLEHTCHLTWGAHCDMTPFTCVKSNLWQSKIGLNTCVWVMSHWPSVSNGKCVLRPRSLLHVFVVFNVTYYLVFHFVITFLMWISFYWPT